MSSRHDDARRVRQALLAEIARAGREHSTAAVLFHGAVADRLGLSATDMKTLDLLLRLGPLTAGEIAAHTGLATASVTALIDRLERRGYARRAHDTIDRRRVIVEALRERLAAADALFGPVGEAFADLFAPYSDEQLEVIRDFLERGARWTRTATARLAEAAERGT